VTSGREGVLDSTREHPALRPDELSNADFQSLPGARPSNELGAQERASWSGGAVQEDAPDPLVGTTLHETYVVARVLGVGGMGRVYEAHHTRIRTKRFAIKVLHAGFARNPEIRIRFQREAEAAATIEHDGVVGTYDVGETPQGWPYMVSEYLAGLDLKDYLKEHGALEPSVVIHIGRQLCSALSAAHARGVIHRDLKPQNIFVLSRTDGPTSGTRTAPSEPELPTVKVLDFGLSRFLESDTELTKTGIILGTPGYMAPEQAHGRETDLRTDVYGIGALLYALATGVPPFKEETPQLTVLAVMNREPLRPRELRSTIPVELEVVIQKAMARDPVERYPDASAMGFALAHLTQTSTRRQGRRYSDWSAFRDPRAGLVLYGLLALTFGSISAIGATISALSLRRIKRDALSLSGLEWLLGMALLAVLLVPAGLALRRFVRRIWDNSARVADLWPKIRRVSHISLASYGLSALIIWTAAVILGMRRGNLSNLALTSHLLLFIVLPGNAMLGATVGLFKEAWSSSRLRSVRLVTNVAYPAFATMLGLGLVFLTIRVSVTETERTQEAQFAAAHPASGGLIAAAPQKLISEPKIPVEPPTPPPSSSISGASKAPEEAAVQASELESEAPKEELAVAAEDGASALEALRERYPTDPKVLKALVFSHASRADTLDKAAEVIGSLLEVEPNSNRDPEVVFILKRALLAPGSAHRQAARAVTTKMGTEGAELLYQLMSEHPEQRNRLKDLFHELRRAKLASAEVSIAYDLRYASSCQSRLALLDRAEKYGDLRSLHQLQALSTAPKRCGWGRTCHPPCRAEAERFRQSVKVITRRLNPPPH
jgi:serine/threonine protein kinase